MSNNQAEKIDPEQPINVADAPDVKKVHDAKGAETIINPGSSKAEKNPFEEAELHLIEEAEVEVTQPKPQKMKLDLSAFKGYVVKGVGVIVIILLIVSTAYNFFELKKYKSIVAGELASNTTRLGSLESSINERSDKVHTLEQVSREHTATLGSLQSNMLSAEKIEKEIAAIEAEIERLKARESAAKQSIETNRANLKPVQGLVSTKPSVSSKRNSKKALRGPAVTPKSYKLEDASLVSIDTWGGSLNAVLRSNNRWVPLSVGELFKGWRLTGVQNGQAQFRKGSKIINLAVKE